MSGTASPGLAVATHLHERQRPIERSNIWRQRAQATFAKAVSFDCPESKANLLKIAEQYQKLERWADERERLRRDADKEQWISSVRRPSEKIYLGCGPQHLK